MTTRRSRYKTIPGIEEPVWAPRPEQAHWTSVGQFAIAPYYPEWSWPPRNVLPSTPAETMVAVQNPDYDEDDDYEGECEYCRRYGSGACVSTGYEAEPPCVNAIAEARENTFVRKFVKQPTNGGPFVPEMYPYGTFGRPAIYEEAKANRGRPTLLKVPSGNTGDFKKTKRAHARDISAVGKYDSWPIGDAYHARLALIYALAPAHKSKRGKVLSAVARHYPMYDWESWWDRKAKGKKDVKPWRSYVASARSNGRGWQPGSFHSTRTPDQERRMSRVQSEASWDRLHEARLLGERSRTRRLDDPSVRLIRRVDEEEEEAEENPRRMTRAKLKAMYRKTYGPDWFVSKSVYARYKKGLRP